MKEATTTDIVDYLCQKGIIIPNNPDYIPTASELIAIDPILAIRLKIADDSKQAEKGSESPTQSSATSGVC